MRQRYHLHKANALEIDDNGKVYEIGRVTEPQPLIGTFENFYLTMGDAKNQPMGNGYFFADQDLIDKLGNPIADKPRPGVHILIKTGITYLFSNPIQAIAKRR